jgi:hypothetical protein
LEKACNSRKIAALSEHPPSLLIVYLRHDHNDVSLYHIDETLSSVGIRYRLIDQQERLVFLESAAPFVMKHNEKRMVFALHAPLDSKVIDEMAQLITIGLILGFVVKGEIVLDDKVGVFNNLGRYGS